MGRVWTCKGCRTRNARIKQKCPVCGKKRPKAMRPAHLKVLDTPRSEWEASYGSTCNICGAFPGTRALHRDHDHNTGKARGLLCFRDNTALKSWMTPEWLRAAADYLERT